MFTSFRMHFPPIYSAETSQLCFPINSIINGHFWLFLPSYNGHNFWQQFLNSSILIALNPNICLVSVYPHFYRLIFKDLPNFFDFLKNLVLKISINWTNKSNIKSYCNDLSGVFRLGNDNHTKVSNRFRVIGFVESQKLVIDFELSILYLYPRTTYSPWIPKPRRVHSKAAF